MLQGFAMSALCCYVVLSTAVCYWVWLYNLQHRLCQIIIYIKLCSFQLRYWAVQIQPKYDCLPQCLSSSFFSVDVTTCVNVNQSRYPLFPLLDIQCFFNSTFTRFVGYKYESYEQKIELLLLFQSRASVHYYTNRSDHVDFSNLFLKAEGQPLQTDKTTLFWEALKVMFIDSMVKSLFQYLISDLEF